MIKKKSSELVKVAVVSALCIGLFSATFVGMNHLTFALATNKTESVPSVTESVVIPPENVLPENYQKPAITVSEVHKEGHIPSANALSAEEAAELGAQYIWEMLGESIDGKVVEMSYSVWPSHTRTYWHGTVLNERWQEPELDAVVEGETVVRWSISRHDLLLQGSKDLFSFTIDAVSGEKIDIVRTYGPYFQNDPDIILAMMEDTDIRKRAVEDMPDPPENLEEYEQTAKDFAQMIFKNSKVEQVVFENSNPVTYARESDGTIVVTSQTLYFKATDDTGREAYVAFNDKTKELLYIMTQHNDIVPGYDYEDHGVG